MGKVYSNQRIRLITGESVYRETADLVGRCNNSQHPGYLVKSILKRKRCIEKSCKHFEAFWGEPFWAQQKSLEQQKKKNKEEKKLAQLQRKERKAQTLSLLEEVMTFVNWLVEAYEVPLIVTGVAQVRQTAQTPGLIVNYVTESASDDADQYRDFAEMISVRFQLDTALRHTRLPDGRYATIEDVRGYTAKRTG